jgi:protein-L-isoaspartate(D-aspartate) O-methyltransferase
MTDFAAARAFMVQGQVRINDVTDPRLTGVMLDVPRERFVPAAVSDLAYLDRDMAVSDAASGPVRYLLKPLTLAKLIQAANISDGDRILDVGCATGYAAALMSKLGGTIVAVEEDPDLARAAARYLAEFGCSQVEVVTGALSDGWKARAPYDVILLEGRTETVPSSLLAQLDDGGHLVCVQGHGAGAKGMLYRSIRGDASGWPLFEAAAPLLPGFAAPASFVF